jgi:hypothetical protein|tara:strand:+ start:3520 stop:4107 length:588 start_codon:yes stop_codon:yes gene_type:complete
MTALRREDLLNLEQYSEQREMLLEEVIEIKKERLIQVGENVSLLFENKKTIQYQIQEMLRIEETFEAKDIEEELNVCNPLIPDGTNLKATMLIEFPEEEIRKKRLEEMHLVEDKVWIQIGENERVFAISDKNIERSNEENIPVTHFLRFEFSNLMIKDFRAGMTMFVGIDHPKYNVRTKEIQKKVTKSLSEDLIL